MQSYQIATSAEALGFHFSFTELASPEAAKRE
jgi:hypothetical protein